MVTKEHIGLIDLLQQQVVGISSDDLMAFTHKYETYKGRRSSLQNVSKLKIRTPLTVMQQSLDQMAKSQREKTGILEVAADTGEVKNSFFDASKIDIEYRTLCAAIPISKISQAHGNNDANAVLQAYCVEGLQTYGHMPALKREENIHDLFFCLVAPQRIIHFMQNNIATTTVSVNSAVFSYVVGKLRRYNSQELFEPHPEVCNDDSNDSEEFAVIADQAGELVTDAAFVLEGIVTKQ